MNIELNKEVEDAQVDQPANPMKYVITVAPNISGGRVECMDYNVTDKGVLFITDKERGISGFIPNGSFGAILPL
jgi:hypothetical protein